MGRGINGNVFGSADRGCDLAVIFTPSTLSVDTLGFEHFLQSKRSLSGCRSCCRRTRHPLFGIDARHAWDCRLAVFIASCLDDLIVPWLCVTTPAHP